MVNSIPPPKFGIHVRLHQPSVLYGARPVLVAPLPFADPSTKMPIINVVEMTISKKKINVAEMTGQRPFTL